MGHVIVRDGQTTVGGGGGGVYVYTIILLLSCRASLPIKVMQKKCCDFLFLSGD